MPLPVNEGDNECRKCIHFDIGQGCIPTYTIGLPPCGRDIVISQKYYKELLAGKKACKGGLLKRILKGIKI